MTRIDLATDEDRLYHLDKWTSFFKAATWEELKMLAKQDEFINEAAATIYEVSRLGSLPAGIKFPSSY